MSHWSLTTDFCRTMLRLSTTLVLAATCLLLSKGVATEMVVTCDVNRVHRLSCDTGVISVQTALYGRADSETCGEGRPPSELGNTECSQEGTADVLKRRCDGKKVCEVSGNDFGTPDPCVDTFKYLQTKYTCLPAIHHVTCEHSWAYLDCDEGQVISIYGATYGRNDHTTCTYRQPASQIQNIDCSQPASGVSTSCNGKNSCIVKVDSSMFEDPCVGTYKYLEVAYICEYPSTIPKESANHQSQGSPQPGSSKSMLSFTLSTTLLLAATCSRMTAVVSAERVITCSGGGNVQHLSCDSGVISVQGALYGRTDKKTCSKGTPRRQLANTKCSQKGTLDVLKSRCNGKTECELNLKVVLTSDPCRGISKYLDTNYTCFPANHIVACENSLAHLQCDEGQVIFVYGADYGRRDQTTCTFSQRASVIKNDACSNPTSKVADSCNGKNSCTIRASNSVFGDPCVGTYKYLEVAYICEYPGVIPQQLPKH
ncbi:L-rhamnose-binding lectin CSL1-like [Clinocottus analis]|uniref:L-rhamnose-binding lectin CSL1-like n=1 Tax=Clinocottus analis TaxID=304258 RepID=UPI0035BEDB22